MLKFAFITAVIAAVGVQTSYLLKDEKVSFVSRVTLEETCELETRSFAIKNVSTGVTKPFVYGEAFIRADKNDILRVVLNEKYKVQFSGKEALAAKRLKIIQDCETPASLKGVFESFNKTFATE